MEKIQHPLQKEYLPVVFYLEDIENLVTVLSEQAHNKVKIIVSDYSYDSVSELEKHSSLEFTKEIEITSTQPYGHLRLYSLGAEVYIGDNSAQSSGVFFKLDKILTSKLRKLSFVYSYYTVWVLNILLLGSIFVENIKGQFWWDIFSYSCYSLIAYVLFIRLKKHSTIILKRRLATPNFLKRNKDQIILLIVGAVIGAVFTKIIDNIDINSFIHMPNQTIEKKIEDVENTTGNL